jgi:NADH-ubiquinone oxidoreductase chain 5
MILIGSITTLIGGTIGLYQNDIKKVIAYSTCSQLGYMVLGCGLSNYGVSLYHLFNHAFFKALLFLSAGSVIHAIQDEQDMRKMGGLINILPFTYGMILIGSLSLMGLPYLTGYYSKDYIIELSYSLYILTGQFNISYILGTITALITSIYSVKLIYLTFISYPNAGSEKKYKEAHECSIYILIPLIILSIASIYIGYITKDIFIGIGTNN